MTEVELEGVVAVEPVVTATGIVSLVEVAVVYEATPSSRTTLR